MSAVTTRMLRAVHAGRRRLGLDEDAYRDLLERVAGQRSAKGLSAQALGRVLDAMRELGFKPTTPRPPEERRPTMEKIRAMLADADRPEAYADAMAKRMFGVERVRWCTPDQLWRVVAALEYDRKRRTDRGDA